MVWWQILIVIAIVVIASYSFGWLYVQARMFRWLIDRFREGGLIGFGILVKRMAEEGDDGDVWKRAKKEVMDDVEKSKLHLWLNTPADLTNTAYWATHTEVYLIRNPELRKRFKRRKAYQKSILKKG